LSFVNFDGASLKGSKLINANLSGANLSNVDLTDADLTGADYETALLNDVKVCRTKLPKPIKNSLDCDSNRS
jgi:uncharacterized protein YjbI with pentapeptide repeats